MTSQAKDTQRGELFLAFLNERYGSLAKSRALDVGCRFGAFTFAMAEEFDRVSGIDINAKALAETKRKAEQFPNVEIEEGSILGTRFEDESFDLITLEGVLEWVGIADPKQAPYACQMQALRECKRLLKPNGLVYVGIENRLFPYFWLRDPHVKVPLVAALPRPLAQGLYKLIKRSHYGLNLQSYWGYRRTFTRVFGDCEILLPIPHYKYLCEVSSFDRDEMRAKVAAVKDDGRFASYGRWIRTLEALTALGLAKLFAPNLVIVARKTA